MTVLTKNSLKFFGGSAPRRSLASYVSRVSRRVKLVITFRGDLSGLLLHNSFVLFLSFFPVRKKKIYKKKKK